MKQSLFMVIYALLALCVLSSHLHLRVKNRKNGVSTETELSTDKNFKAKSTKHHKRAESLKVEIDRNAKTSGNVNNTVVETVVTDDSKDGKDGKKKKDSSKIELLNSVGRQVYVKAKDEIFLTDKPFTVTRCDQILRFKAQFLPDMGEYRTRETGYFTLTSHYVNLFTDDKFDKLLRSILMSEVTIAPNHPTVRGAFGCILITSPPFGDKDITICMDTNDEMSNVLTVLRTFFDCRGGDKMNKVDKAKLAEMLIKCGGTGKFVNPVELLKKLRKQFNQQKTFNKMDSKYWHPGYDGLPGVAVIDNNKENMKKRIEQIKNEHDPSE